jgi:hypothetical protein
MNLHSDFRIAILDGFVKSRHFREARSRCLKQRESTGSQLLKKNGFPTKNFENDSFEKDFKGRTFYESKTVKELPRSKLTGYRK